MAPKRKRTEKVTRKALTRSDYSKLDLRVEYTLVDRHRRSKKQKHHEEGKSLSADQKSDYQAADNKSHAAQALANVPLDDDLLFPSAEDCVRLLNDPQHSRNTNNIGLFVAQLASPIPFIQQLFDQIQEASIRAAFKEACLKELLTCICDYPQSVAHNTCALFACMRLLFSTAEEMVLVDKAETKASDFLVQLSATFYYREWTTVDRKRQLVLHYARCDSLEASKKPLPDQLCALLVGMCQIDMRTDLPSPFEFITSEKIFAFTPALKEDVVIPKLTNVIDALNTEIKKGGFPLFTAHEYVPQATEILQRELKAHGEKPFSTHDLVRIYWPLVRCVFDTLKEADQNVFTLPLVKKLVTPILLDLEKSSMHALFVDQQFSFL